MKSQIRLTIFFKGEQLRQGICLEGDCVISITCFNSFKDVSLQLAYTLCFVYLTCVSFQFGSTTLKDKGGFHIHANSYLNF